MKQTLWCDEGVHHISRELQLLSHDSFHNIFLGIGGFHMEKAVIACLGKYLKGTGIDKVLVNNEIYWSISIETVLNGGHNADLIEVLLNCRNFGDTTVRHIFLLRMTKANMINLMNVRMFPKLFQIGEME